MKRDLSSMGMLAGLASFFRGGSLVTGVDASAQTDAAETTEKSGLVDSEVQTDMLEIAAKPVTKSVEMQTDTNEERVRASIKPEDQVVIEYGDKRVILVKSDVIPLVFRGAPDTKIMLSALQIKLLNSRLVNEQIVTAGCAAKAEIIFDGEKGPLWNGGLALKTILNHAVKFSGVLDRAELLVRFMPADPGMKDLCVLLSLLKVREPQPELLLKNSVLESAVETVALVFQGKQDTCKEVFTAQQVKLLNSRRINEALAFHAHATTIEIDISVEKTISLRQGGRLLRLLLDDAIEKKFNVEQFFQYIELCIKDRTTDPIVQQMCMVLTLLKVLAPDPKKIGCAVAEGKSAGCAGADGKSAGSSSAECAGEGKDFFVDPRSIKETFADYVGDIPKEVKELTEYLKDPAPFMAWGVRCINGILFEGPPGTGKTLLARILAHEAGCPFFYIAASQTRRKWLGESEGLVRKLFDDARAAATAVSKKEGKDKPAIVFIDEIDAMGMMSATSDHNSILKELLIQMDGLTTKESKNVIVIAATNRADLLDAALKRSGRFDSHITFVLPDAKVRALLFRKKLETIQLQEGVGSSKGVTTLNELCAELAGMTEGFSPADITNCVDQAKRSAAYAHEPLPVAVETLGTYLKDAVEKVRTKTTEKMSDEARSLYS